MFKVFREYISRQKPQSVNTFEEKREPKHPALLLNESEISLVQDLIEQNRRNWQEFLEECQELEILVDSPTYNPKKFEVAGNEILKMIYKNNSRQRDKILRNYYISVGLRIEKHNYNRRVMGQLIHFNN